MSRKEALQLIEALRADQTIWAASPCGHEYRLSDSELFFGSEFTPAARDFLELQEEELTDLSKEAKDLRHKFTAGFTKRSVEVKMGRTLEKVVPVMPGFPYEPLDCRAIFDPIDYVAFVGAAKNAVSRVDFIDVKTGNAQLKPNQKDIRDAVLDGKVRLRKVGP